MEPRETRAPRLLVVDDDPSVRALYADEFADDGYEVLAVAGGREALAVLDDFAPDVVTLDIRMPGMDGIETLRAIKARYSRLPVVLSTAYEQYKDDFGSWACDEYVVKSADLAELKASVRRALDCARRASAA